MRLLEIVRYGFGAAIAFSVDIILLGILVEWFNMHYLLAATISFLAGTAVIYWISIRYVFSVRRVTDARVEFGLFTAIGAMGVVLNLACMYIAVDRLGLHFLLGKVMSAGITFIANFSVRRGLLFANGTNTFFNHERNSGHA